MTGADKRAVARRERLISEVRDEQVPFLDAGEIPAALGKADEIEPLLVAETLHARHVEVHEGVRSPYGCLLVPSITDFPAKSLLATTTNEAGIGELRRYADGIDTFLLRDRGGDAAIAVLDSVDELALVRLTRQHGAISVQRERTGDVKIITKSMISINSSYEWLARPHASQMVAPLRAALQLPAELLKDVLSGLADLLDFCVHLLSPHGIGATFVVALGRPVEDLRSGLGNEGHRADFGLNTFDPDHQRALAPLLASVDGACLIAADGALYLYEAMLRSAKTAEVVAQHGGTRHTSAKRFSFEHDDVLVIVVSADGKTTAFSDGMAVMELFPPSVRRQPWNLRYAHHDAQGMKSETVQKLCETCQKSIRITVLESYEKGAAHDYACPVCHTEGLAAFTNIIGEYTTFAAEKSWDTQAASQLHS